MIPEWIQVLGISTGLWRHHGACESLTIRVVVEAQIAVKVRYGENGNHRVDWVKIGNQASLIDLSSRCAF